MSSGHKSHPDHRVPLRKSIGHCRTSLPASRLVLKSVSGVWILTQTKMLI